MGQDGEIRKSSGRLSTAEFQLEVSGDQSREDRLLWWELGVVAVIGAFALLCRWIDS